MRLWPCRHVWITIDEGIFYPSGRDGISVPIRVQRCERCGENKAFATFPHRRQYFEPEWAIHELQEAARRKHEAKEEAELSKAVDEAWAVNVSGKKFLTVEEFVDAVLPASPSGQRALVTFCEVRAYLINKLNSLLEIRVPDEEEV